MSKEPDEGKTIPGEAVQANTSLPPETSQPSREEIERLTREIGELKAQLRGLQSDKDRGVKRVEASLQELVAKISPYLPITEEQAADAIRRATLDEIVRERMTPAAPPLAREDSEQEAVRISDIAAELGLSADDPAVLAASKGTKDPVKLAVQLAKVAAQRASQPAPSPASAPAPSVPPAAEPDIEALTQEYIAEMVKNRGNREAILRVKEAYRKRGVPVDQVAFT